MADTIKVTSKEKITSIRVSESTKKQLESLGTSAASHEDILKQLINLAKSMESETKIIMNKNILGTRYAKLTRTLNIELDKNKYSIVCTYNDISLMALVSTNKNLQGDFPKEWEIDMEIVNIGIYEKNVLHWKDPKSLYDKNKKEFLLLYLIAAKQILEERFAVKIYEILTEGDYFNAEKWKAAYLRNKLSLESFYKDIEKRIKDAK